MKAGVGDCGDATRVRWVVCPSGSGVTRGDLCLRYQDTVSGGRSPIPDPKGSFVILSLDVRLNHVVNLCDEHEQRLLGTNSQELTWNWVNHIGFAPTKKLGAGPLRSRGAGRR